MKAVRLHRVRPLSDASQSSEPATSSEPLRDDEGEASLHAAIQVDAPEWKQRAFDEFYGLVHGLLLKSLGPHADVDDLVSEVFIKFYDSAFRIRKPDAVRSYIVSVTMNTVRHEVRRHRRRLRFWRWSGNSQEELERQPGTDDPKAKAALVHLDRILQQLDVEERSAFVLRNLEGLQINEIAEALNTSESTVKRRLRHANERMLRKVSRNALLADYIRDRTGARHG